MQKSCSQGKEVHCDVDDSTATPRLPTFEERSLDVAASTSGNDRELQTVSNGTSGHRMNLLGLHDPSLPWAQSTCHRGQWCNEVGVIGLLSLSFPRASSDDRSASTHSYLVSSDTLTDFSEG
ncbi:hypothetical protein TNCV_2562821 [Trichonephila clavipes]|uniref:Uncharacterized protein n=1 Tax=Trichonephila clavipes TaxID=2585209 RepID=A0A8X6R0Z9_TRICX|nr:hypothetical protein TNCV_2562821 [Trichonephila clavipes]